MKLRRDMMWNAAGSGLPMLVGVLVIPSIIKGLGTEKFGYLSIVWSLIGYFSIFDLGLGRSVTHLAADRLAKGMRDEIAPVTGTALVVVLASSALISVVAALSAAWITDHILHASPSLRSQATEAILWLSLSLPFVITASILTGTLEAYRKFSLTNAARIPLGVLMLVTPCALLPFTNDLGVITAVLGALRVVNSFVLLQFCLRTVPGLSSHLLTFRRELMRPLISFGGWLSVSNVVGPAMVYFDRFIIAAVLGGTAIAYYTVPYDVLTRLWVVPTAIQGVLFPTFTTLVGSDQSARVTSVFQRSASTTFQLMIPAVLAVMLLARDGLTLWVGPVFAAQSATVAKILVVGVLANALARIPATLVQGAGYAKWTAILHVAELPSYGITLWLLLGRAGIEGAAAAWSVRMTLDTIALYVMTLRIDRAMVGPALRDLSLLCGVSAAAALLGSIPLPLAARASIVLLGSAVCAFMLLQQLHLMLPVPARRAR